jgi:hypothetical protein
MGEDYIQSQFNVPAANARREGSTLFDLVMAKVEGSLAPALATAGASPSS